MSNQSCSRGTSAAMDVELGSGSEIGVAAVVVAEHGSRSRFGAKHEIGAVSGAEPGTATGPVVEECDGTEVAGFKAGSHGVEFSYNDDVDESSDDNLENLNSGQDGEQNQDQDDMDHDKEQSEDEDVENAGENLDLKQVLEENVARNPIGSVDHIGTERHSVSRIEEDWEDEDIDEDTEEEDDDEDISSAVEYIQEARKVMRSMCNNLFVTSLGSDDSMFSDSDRPTGTGVSGRGNDIVGSSTSIGSSGSDNGSGVTGIVVGSDRGSYGNDWDHCNLAGSASDRNVNDGSSFNGRGSDISLLAKCTDHRASRTLATNVLIDLATSYENTLGSTGSENSSEYKGVSCDTHVPLASGTHTLGSTLVQSEASASQSKASTSQSKVSASQSKASASQSKVSASQSKVSASQSKVSTSHSKASASHRKASTSHSKVSTSHSRASISSTRFSDSTKASSASTSKYPASSNKNNASAKKSSSTSTSKSSSSSTSKTSGASTSESSVPASNSSALTSKSSASASKRSAPTSKSSALTSKSSASTNKSSASTSKCSAPTNKSSASNNKSSASNNKSSASNNKSSASTNKSSASTIKNYASPIKSSASSKSGAPTGECSAPISKSNASTNRSSASSRKNSASTSKSSASTSKTHALTSKSSASSSKNGAPTRKISAPTGKSNASTNKSSGASTSKGPTASSSKCPSASTSKRFHSPTTKGSTGAAEICVLLDGIIDVLNDMSSASTDQVAYSGNSAHSGFSGNSEMSTFSSNSATDEQATSSTSSECSSNGSTISGSSSKSIDGESSSTINGGLTASVDDNSASSTSSAVSCSVSESKTRVNSPARTPSPSAACPPSPVSPGSPISDKTCPICLCTMTDECAAGNCMHRFCFDCLKQWVKQKALCPLCKKSFTVIIYDIRSDSDFKEWKVPARPCPVLSVSLERAILLSPFFGLNSALLSYGPATALAEIDFILPSAGPRPILPWYPPMSRHALLQRQRIYDEDLWVQMVSDTGHHRESNPRLYTEQPALAHRLGPWLSRELKALNVSSSLIIIIMELVARVQITSRAFYRALRPIFGHKTTHFIHEFHCYARSSYDIFGYDDAIIGHYGAYVSRVSPPVSVDEDELSDNNDLVEIDLTNESASGEAGPSIGSSGFSRIRSNQPALDDSIVVSSDDEASNVPPADSDHLYHRREGQGSNTQNPERPTETRFSSTVSNGLALPVSSDRSLRRQLRRWDNVSTLNTLGHESDENNMSVELSADTVVTVTTRSLLDNTTALTSSLGATGSSGTASDVGELEVAESSSSALHCGKPGTSTRSIVGASALGVTSTTADTRIISSASSSSMTSCTSQRTRPSWYGDRQRRMEDIFSKKLYALRRSRQPIRSIQPNGNPIFDAVLLSSDDDGSNNNDCDSDDCCIVEEKEPKTKKMNLGVVSIVLSDSSSDGGKSGKSKEQLPKIKTEIRKVVPRLDRVSFTETVGKIAKEEISAEAKPKLISSRTKISFEGDSSKSSDAVAASSENVDSINNSNKTKNIETKTNETNVREQKDHPSRIKSSTKLLRNNVASPVPALVLATGSVQGPSSAPVSVAGPSSTLVSTLQSAKNVKSGSEQYYDADNPFNVKFSSIHNCPNPVLNLVKSPSVKASNSLVSRSKGKQHHQHHQRQIEQQGQHQRHEKEPQDQQQQLQQQQQQRMKRIRTSRSSSSSSSSSIERYHGVKQRKGAVSRISHRKQSHNDHCDYSPHNLNEPAPRLLINVGMIVRPEISSASEDYDFFKETTTIRKRKWKFYDSRCSSSKRHKQCVGLHNSFDTESESQIQFCTSANTSTASKKVKFEPDAKQIKISVPRVSGLKSRPKKAEKKDNVINAINAVTTSKTKPKHKLLPNYLNLESECLDESANYSEMSSESEYDGSYLKTSVSRKRKEYHSGFVSKDKHSKKFIPNIYQDYSSETDNEEEVSKKRGSKRRKDSTSRSGSNDRHSKKIVTYKDYSSESYNEESNYDDVKTHTRSPEKLRTKSNKKKSKKSRCRRRSSHESPSNKSTKKHGKSADKYMACHMHDSSSESDMVQQTRDTSSERDMIHHRRNATLDKHCNPSKGKNSTKAKKRSHHS